MNIEKERELFEAFISDTWLSDADWNENCNTYKESSIHMMWTSWIASLNRDGYVLVPLEPTPKMIDSTWDYDEDIHEMSHNSRNEFIYKAMIGACDDH